VTDPAADQGLSAKQAAKRLRELGQPPETSSRSTSSIVAGNVFTLFNAIIGAFFVLDLGLGLYADSVFGAIAVINSYIGIRQELKAKRTLDALAVLVAPQAKVIRDGAVTELRAEEIVPGDLVAVEPGDQLVADGEVVASRGMTLDESMLTGEADGVAKDRGERALSGSFCISGSGRYVVDAVREDSYAGRLSGEARAFRHPPSPLQSEVNQVIVACVYVMVPLALILLVTLKLRSTGLTEAAQTATAGLVTLIPEGLVLLMTITFMAAAIRLAHRRTLVQQMSATESLASVDTICVDKTGTLTDGELRLLGIRVPEGVDEGEAQRALAGYAASAGDRNRTLEAVAERFPAEPGRVTG
jgi:cation-transporting P-type ATPase E